MLWMLDGCCNSLTDNRWPWFITWLVGSNYSHLESGTLLFIELNCGACNCSLDWRKQNIRCGCRTWVALGISGQERKVGDARHDALGPSHRGGAWVAGCDNVTSYWAAEIVLRFQLTVIQRNANRLINGASTWFLAFIPSWGVKTITISIISIDDQLKRR